MGRNVGPCLPIVHQSLTPKAFLYQTRCGCASPSFKQTCRSFRWHRNDHAEGRYVIEHDNGRMARGKPCTRLYAYNDQLTPVGQEIPQRFLPADF